MDAMFNAEAAIVDYVRLLWSNFGVLVAPYKLCLLNYLLRSLAAHAKGPGFDSLIAQHVQILISQAFTYGTVGSLVELVLGPTTWVHFIPVALDSIV